MSFGTSGWGVSASFSKSNGDANSDSTFQNNSHINASNTAVIVSGGDTNIVGGNVNADKVIARVGGDLNIASVQDTSESSAHQESMGGGFSASMGGASGSFSYSRGNASGNYAGVVEQAGIQAGSGGFDINVAGNTDLKGSYIASTADPSKNQLTTGTLTFSDIQNHSDYSANSFGFGGGGSFGNGGANERTTGPSSGKNTGGIAPMLPQSESGSERGVTRSGVSDGTITLTNGANQTQDLASLNRDTSNLNETVNRTPDLQNLLNDQSRLMAAATAAGEAVARDIGTYADKKREAAQKLADATTDPELKAQYQKEADDWKEGGDYRAAMHAAGGAIIAGLGGGNALGGALGAGLTSKLGGTLNELSENIQNARPTGNADIDQALAQIVATGVGTAVGAAVGGSSGAFTGYNVDRFNRQLHPDEYAMAKKNAKVVAKHLGISEQDAEGRIVAELLRNSDKQTSDAAGGVHDYEVRAIIGCQNLNCDGYKSDPQYANNSYNSQYIASNQQAYDAGQGKLTQGLTYNDLVKYNVKNNPISTAIADAGMIALGGAVAGGVPSAIAMITGGGIGAGVNTGAQYVFNNGQISLVDTAMAGVTGALTFGTGLLPGFLINTGGALAGSAIRGDNPNMSMAGAAAGTVAGYGIGGKVESAIGNRVNPWYRAEWVDIGLGISKYVPPSAIPSVAGTTAGAVASESASAGVNAGPNLMPKNK